MIDKYNGKNFIAIATNCNSPPTQSTIHPINHPITLCKIQFLSYICIALGFFTISSRIGLKGNTV